MGRKDFVKLNWLKKIFGSRGSKYSTPVTAPKSIETAERVLMSNIDIGVNLVRQLECDSNLTEASLAASIGRNSAYVRRVIRAAREAAPN